MSSLKYLTCKHQSINESIPRSTFEGLGGELFILVGDHVDAERELIDARLFTTQVVNTDLGIGDTPEKEGEERGRKERKGKEKEEREGQGCANKGKKDGKGQERRNREETGKERKEVRREMEEQRKKVVKKK